MVQVRGVINWQKVDFSIKRGKIMQKVVYQRLNVTLECWLTPKSWLTPGENKWFWPANIIKNKIRFWIGDLYLRLRIDYQSLCWIRWVGDWKTLLQTDLRNFLRHHKNSWKRALRRSLKFFLSSYFWIE